VIVDDWDVVDMMLARTDNTAGNADMILPVFSGRFELSGRLNLSTLHSAKGREFDIVVLFDMNKATLPSDMDQRTPEDLTDARRLFYVGVTRARKQLHLVFKTKHYSPWVAELYRRGKQSGWIA
jgi:DNA helicase-2/ATP-dependent DNA helicase PcrA